MEHLSNIYGTSIARVEWLGSSGNLNTAMVSLWGKAVEAAKAEYKGKDKHKLNCLVKVKYGAMKAPKAMKQVAGSPSQGGKLFFPAQGWQTWAAPQIAGEMVDTESREMIEDPYDFVIHVSSPRT